MGIALTNLGEIARRRRQVDEAAALQRQSASLFASAGDSIGEAAALTNLAAARLELGTLDEAHVALVRAVTLWQRAGERSDLAECLELFTALAVQRGQAERAVRLAAAAAALREITGTVPSPTEAARHEADLVGLRRSIDAARFTGAWREGWAMNADEAVALALEQHLEPCLSDASRLVDLPNPDGQRG
ncbi:MAG: tetratricopeptide repeat protein [Ilumatobacteraceae bacterium]